MGKDGLNIGIVSNSPILGLDQNESFGLVVSIY